MSERTRLFLILGGMTTLAFILRIWNIADQSFWQDEIFTYKIVEPGWSGLVWRGASITSSPPLYYAIVRLFFFISPAEFGMRFPSAMIGAMTVPLFYYLGYMLLSNRVALISSLMLTLSPFHIWYSQDARPYTLFMLLCLCSSIFFLKILNKQRKLWWILYSISVIIGFYVHILTTLIIASHFVLWLVWSKHKKPELSKMLLCYVVSFLFIAPILPILFKGMGVASGIGRSFAFLSLPYTFYALLSGFSLGPSTYNLHHFSFSTAIVPYVFSFILFAIAFISCGVIGISELLKRKAISKVIGVWILVPLTFLVILANITHHAFNVRYISSLLFPLLLLYGIGIDSIGNFALKLILFIAVVTCQSISIWNYFTNTEYFKSDFRSACLFIDRESHSDDLIYIVGPITTFRHYYKGICKNIVRQSHRRESLEYVRGKFSKAVNKSKRIWLIESRWEQYDPYRYAKKNCNNNLIASKNMIVPSFDRIKISCYKIR